MQCTAQAEGGGASPPIIFWCHSESLRKPGEIPKIVAAVVPSEEGRPKSGCIAMQSNLDRVCVVIGRTRHRMVAAEIQEAARRGAKMLEIRLDFIPRAPDFRRIVAAKPCPLVATLRRREDGGRWSGTEDERQMLLRQCVVGGFDWVDLETDVADEIRRFGPAKRIVSYHNLDRVPDDLDEIYAK